MCCVCRAFLLPLAAPRAPPAVRLVHDTWPVQTSRLPPDLTRAAAAAGARQSAVRPLSSLLSSSPAGHSALCPSVCPTDRLTTRWERYGRADPERSSAPQSPGWRSLLSEDATPQFHLCVGVSVHGRDHGSAVPQLHVPLRRGPDLAGAHAPLHARTVRAGAAHPHLHPPGPEQGQTAGSAAAHPAARTHRQVSVSAACLCLWVTTALPVPHGTVSVLSAAGYRVRRRVLSVEHVPARRHIKLLNVTGWFDECVARVLLLLSSPPALLV